LKSQLLHIKIKYILTTIWFLCCGLSFVWSAGLPKSGIQFTENKGQWSSNVLFKSDIPIGNLFVEKNSLTYLFIDKEATHKIQHGEKLKSVAFQAIKVSLLGSNPNPIIIKDQRSDTYYNYFVGSSDKWASNVYAYKKLTMKNIYPYTDMEIISMGERIKINFVLLPGANPSAIQLHYEGANKLFIKNNQLHITSNLGELVEDSPVSFQRVDSIQEQIATKFILKNNTITFDLKKYNPNLPIIIDPSVIFGTYMGSSADNFGFAASYDKLGNAYGAGTVYAANFPATTGAYDISFNGGNGDNGEYARDGFIAKFSANGQNLLFATFFGGAHNEQPHSVSLSNAANGNNDIFIFGTTYSADFPVTNNSFDNSYNGGADIFILKLNEFGNTLLGSTYIGGTQDDGINGDANQSYLGQTHALPYNYADWFRGEIVLDNTGNIYVSTCSKSIQNQGLPLINASQSIFGGGTQDAYIIKLNNSLSNILFSTYLGGPGDESAHSICINLLNEPIIAGGTTSANLMFGTSSFPYNGGVDGFIGKYSSSGVKQRVIYTGTSSYDQTFFVQVDDNNNIYTMGQTAGNMPRNTGTYGTNNAKQFLEKYNSSLTTKLLATTFGKVSGTQPSLSPAAFLVDICGRIYISGWGGGTNQSYHNGLDNVFGMPITNDAFQKTTDGSDFYLMVLSPNFESLSYASFYGGSQSQEHVDGGTSHFDRNGIIYQAACAGCGGLNDFPTTPTAYSRTNPGKRAFNTNVGGCNLGMFKFDMRTYLLAPVLRDTILTIYAGKPLAYTFTATDAGGDKLTMTYSGSIFNLSNNPASITTIQDIPGLLSAELRWNSNCSDYGTDTLVVEIKITDSACPISNEIKAKIKIVLLSDPIAPPYPECIKVINDTTLELKWTNTNPSSDFLNYQLFRKKGNEQFNLYDSIGNQATNLYFDTKANGLLDTNYCFQLLTLNSCRLAGDTSRFICSKPDSDTAGGVFFKGLADEFYQLSAFDTFSGSFFIQSILPQDSVFIKVSGFFTDKKVGTISSINSLGSGFAGFKWIPGCEFIDSDTMTLYIQVRDNSCPYFRQGLKRVHFLVSPAKQAENPQINCPRKDSRDSILLAWNAFTPKPLTQEFKLIRWVNNLPESIHSFTDFSVKEHIDVYFHDEKNKVCYSFTSKDICGIWGDTSKPVCIQGAENPVQSLFIYTATVVEDKEIDLVWQQAEADSFWRYQIWKKEGRFSNKFELIGDIKNLQDTVFTDKNVDVDKDSYCYKIVNIDVCGNKSASNKEACTILLTGNSEPFINKMDWMPYDYWEQGINRYEILKSEPFIYTDQLLSSKTDKPLLISDKQLNYDNGLYQYTIMAYENIFGNKQTSRSNTIDLIQLPILHTPNAYTENGDGLNDSFATVPVFVKDYHIQIFNRWGERIFESRNKKEGFNGQYRGEEIKSDVYFYIINYAGWDGKSLTKKGNFTLLR
jgi:gliding motility-associated-like protein